MKRKQQNVSLAIKYKLGGVEKIRNGINKTVCPT